MVMDFFDDLSGNSSDPGSWIAEIWQTAHLLLRCYAIDEGHAFRGIGLIVRAEDFSYSFIGYYCTFCITIFFCWRQWGGSGHRLGVWLDSGGLGWT